MRPRVELRPILGRNCAETHFSGVIVLIPNLRSQEAWATAFATTSMMALP